MSLINPLIWQRVNGDVLYLQYWYKGVVFERKPAARADMTLNNDTFALTIGRVQLEDDIFVCYKKWVQLESVKLVVYSKLSVLLYAFCKKY